LRYQEIPVGYIVNIERGEELIRSLIRFARRQSIEAATLTGLGAVESVELGYYDLDKQDYDRRRFDEELEACALSGNLSMVDGEPFPHIHGVFGRANFATVGGHVFDAVASISLELTITTSPITITRGPVDFCNLQLLELSEDV
jgi:uncharacterized protein